MSGTLDDRERREQERARRREQRQAGARSGRAGKAARPGKSTRAPKAPRTRAAAASGRHAVDETGPMQAVAVQRHDQHEGLVTWLARSILRIPRAIAAILGGFVREVGDVLASLVRPVARLVPTRRASRSTSPAIIDIEQDGLGGAFGDAVAGLRRRREEAPAVLSPAQQRAADRRRALLRRRTRGGVAITLVVLGVVCWRIVPSSDAFSVRHVEIIGASSVGDLEVRMRVDDLLRDQTIYTIDTEAMQSQVSALPFVRSVQVDRHFPGGVTIRVVEHRPLALGYDTAKNSWWLIAPDGRVLAKGSEDEWRDRIPLVRLDATNVKPGMRLEAEPAVELLRARASDSTLAIGSIEVTPSSVTATIQDDVQVRFGRPRQLRTKVAAAERMLQIGRDKGWKLAYIDVSVPANPVPCQLGRPCATMPAPDAVDPAEEAAAGAARSETATPDDAAATGATATDADDAAAADDGAVTSTAPRLEQGPSPTTAATVLANAEAQTGDKDAPRDGFEAATRPDEATDATGTTDVATP